MADRSVNIRINYIIDTSSLDRAKTATNQAQQATDNLRGSTTKNATDSANAYRNLSTTLEGLNVKLAQLKGQISLTKLNDPKLPQLSQQYKDLKTQIDATTKSLLANQTATKSVGQATQTLASQFGNLYTAVKTFIAASLVKELVSSGLEMSKLAGNVEGVKIAFDRLPGSITLLDTLKQKTHGTVNEFDLMRKAIFAADFGIPVQKLGILLEFAAARAQQTGLSVDYLVDSIVRGIGQKSILRLDNLGLSAERLKNELGGASIKTKSIADVTEAVSRIAQEELGKMGGYVETAATKVDQLESSWNKLKVTVSEFFSKGNIPTALKGYVDAFQTLIEAQQRGIAIADVLRERSVLEGAIIQVNGIKEDMFTESRENNIKVTKDQIDQYTHYLLGLQDASKQLDLNLEKEKSASVEALYSAQAQLKKANAIQKNIDANKREREETIQVIKILKQLNQELVDESKQPVAGQLGIIERKKEEIALIQKAIEETNKPSDLGFGGKLILDLQKAQEELSKLEGKVDEARKGNTVFTAVVEIGFKDPETGEVKKVRQSSFIKKFLDDFGIDLTKDAKDDIINIPFTFKPTIKMDWRGLADGAIQIQTDQLDSLVQNEQNAYAQRINNAQRYYDNQILLAGDNDKAKAQLEIKRNNQLDRLRREQFEKDKEANKLKAVINGAGAIARAFVDHEFYEALVISALAAAEVASQVAIIDRQTPNFKDGVIDLKGPGTTTSDSIQANLSKGESVMTAAETFKAKGILEMIRGNKLDDNILKQLQLTQTGVKYVGMTDDRIVKAIEKQRFPDIVRIGNDVYEVKKAKDGINKSIRRKSMGNG